MKTYLVTGAAGFIGANYIKYILAKHNDIKVVILDALTYAGNLGTIANDIDDERCFFVKGAICDRVLADELFAKYKPGVQRQRMKLLRLNRLHLWKSHRPPKRLRSRWKLLQLPNLRRQQPLRRHPNRHRPPRPRRQQSLRQSPPQNPRKPRWRKP